jgi:2-phosphosulfolactate phosphatase
MDVEFFFTPACLSPPLGGKTVIVFDVLRATTTITAALVAGIRSVRVFADLSQAKAAAAAANPRPILCGELHALPAPGVDMGNSPGQFGPQHAGRDVYLSTTNGTKALAAARSADNVFAGALVNAAAVADAAAATDRPILLLGSGTEGEVSMEDTLGAGAVCSRLLKRPDISLIGDGARLAYHLFNASRDHLPAVLRDTQGGRNNLKVGLDADVDFAARLNVFNIVGVMDRENLVIRPSP